MARRIAHRVAGTGRPGPDELLRSGLEVLNVGIAVFDRDLTLVACNEAFGELRGYPAALCRPGTAMAELLRFNAERGDYGPGDVEKHVRSRLQRVRKFEPHELEYQLATGRILNIRYHPIGGDGLLLSFYDMTETRRAEAALRESEARYALVEQAATEGIYEWLIDKSELHASPRMKQLFGFSAGKVDSRNWGWNARVHPDDFERYKAALRDHFKGRSETYECEYRVRDESGHYRWILDRGVCVRNENGRAVRLVGAISDVTEHVRRETELAEKTAILESTLENMDQGISMVDGELKVIAFNRRFLELLDFPAERFKRGYHMAEAFRYNAERGEYGPGDVETLVQERIELAKRFESHHFERTRPDGTVIEIHGRPLPNKGGFVTTYTDITERVNAERAIRKQNQALDTFAQMVAHDLKSLITTINGYSGLLKESIHNDTAEKRDELLDTIIDAGFQMSDIITELLLLARVRREDVRTEPVPMLPAIKAALKRLQPRVEELGARIALPPELPVVHGHTRWLEEVWYNLASNALAYGGPSPVVEIGHTSGEDGSIRFWIKDEGQGLSAEQVRQLMEPVEGTSYSWVQGHGLGLTVVRNILEKLDSALHVECLEGDGCKFSFHLLSVQQ